MFKTKKLPLTKREKMTNCIIIMIAILSVMVVWLADLTFEFVASKIYPITEIEVIEVESKKSIAEHICLATNGENCDILVNLAMCESSLNPNAVGWNTNRTIDLGLFQINSVHKDITAVEKLDVYASARWANNKIKAGKLHIWVCADKI